MAAKQSTPAHDSIPNATTIPTRIEDTVEYLRECSQAFGQVRAILAVIKEKSDEYSDIYQLAGAASHIATDFESVADSWREGTEALATESQP